MWIALQNGVDINSCDRALLRSAKPTLHTNVDCTPLVAAIVSRQVPVVKYLLEVIDFVIARENLIARFDSFFENILMCDTL